MKKAIFLDRDWTINIDNWYTYKVEDCKLIDKNIWKILKSLQQIWYLLIIVTNQAGIDRGYYKEEDFRKFMKELEKQLGIKFDWIYFCPYHPDFSWDHNCRKPNNWMIVKAQQDYNIDLESSYMIGDTEKDIIVGKISNCTTILINTKNITSNTLREKPDFIVKNWKEIEKIITLTQKNN